MCFRETRQERFSFTCPELTDQPEDIYCCTDSDEIGYCCDRDRAKFLYAFRTDEEENDQLYLPLRMFVTVLVVVLTVFIIYHNFFAEERKAEEEEEEEDDDVEETFATSATIQDDI